MKEIIENAINEARNFTAENLTELEQFRVKFLGKKGIITELFILFKDMSASEKKETGKLLNELKKLVQEKVDQYSSELSVKREYSSNFDLTLPASQLSSGSRHPISIVRKEIIDIFSRIGFTISCRILFSSLKIPMYYSVHIPHRFR